MVTIDEFGWDYDGGIDQHTMDILNALHEKKPGLRLAVWQMRGPVAPKLAQKSAPRLAMSRPARAAAPRSSAPPPPAGAAPPPEAETLADFTGVTMTNDA